DTGGQTDIPLRCLKAVGVHSLAVVAYCCLFGLMSLLTRWTLILGFLYAALVEGLLANLPFAARWLTIIYHCRLIAYLSMEFTLNVHRMPRQLDMASEAWQLGAETDPQLLEHPALGTCLAV